MPKDKESNTEVDTEEGNQNPDELSPEEEAQAAADFESGFSVARTGEEPGPADEDKDENEDDTDKDEDDGKDGDGSEDDAGTSASEGADEDDEDAPVVVTRGQLKRFESAMTKLDSLNLDDINNNIRSLHGRFGEFNDRLNKAGGAKKITKENLKKLSEEYPDIAELMAEDLSGVFGEGGGFDFSELPPDLETHINNIVSRSVEAARQEAAEEIMDVRSPGWKQKMFAEPVLNEDGSVKEIPFTQDFETYLDSLTEEDRNAVLKSNSPSFMAGTISKFDTWKEKRAKKAKEKADKHKRLELSIQDKGDGGTPSHSTETDDEGAFVAGFKEVRGGRG